VKNRGQRKQGNNVENGQSSLRSCIVTWPLLMHLQQMMTPQVHTQLQDHGTSRYQEAGDVVVVAAWTQRRISQSRTDDATHCRLLIGKHLIQSGLEDQMFGCLWLHPNTRAHVFSQLPLSLVFNLQATKMDCINKQVQKHYKVHFTFNNIKLQSD
jgi:hypothetical protein